MFHIDRMACGCRHDQDFVLDCPMGYAGYLALFVKTKAIFVIDGQTIETEPDTFIIFDHGSPQYYKANGGEYINDWIQFTCTEQLTSGIPIQFDKPLYIGETINAIHIIMSKDHSIVLLFQTPDLFRQRCLFRFVHRESPFCKMTDNRLLYTVILNIQEYQVHFL